MENPATARKLQALREILDPAAVALWLDEIEQNRRHLPTRRAHDDGDVVYSGPEQMLTVTELADSLQVRRSWVYGRSRSSDFPTHRVGRYLRFRLSEVERWIAEQEHS